MKEEEENNFFKDWDKAIKEMPFRGEDEKTKNNRKTKST